MSAVWKDNKELAVKAAAVNLLQHLPSGIRETVRPLRAEGMISRDGVDVFQIKYVPGNNIPSAEMSQADIALDHLHRHLHTGNGGSDKGVMTIHRTESGLNVYVPMTDEGVAAINRAEQAAETARRKLSRSAVQVSR